MIHNSAARLVGLSLPVLIILALVTSIPGKVLGQQFEELPPAKAPAAPRPPQKAPDTEPGARSTEPQAGGDGGLRRRVEQLEEQLVDIQVVIGTLESLTRSGAAAPSARGGASGGFAPSDAARVDGMETQIRALTTQIEQLAGEVRALGGPQRRTDTDPIGRPNAPKVDGASELPPVTPERPGAAGVPERFGSTTVTPEGGDPIGGLLSRDAGASPPPRSGEPPVAALGADPAPPPTDAAAGNPKQLYETAYGYLLQQNYKAAETAFDEFLKRYPNDSLSGNAQYWLGESHFVRGEYKAAAGAFLKGYETYASSTKAPDSLLKLAMSLDRLGQKDAACSSYSELATKFPNAAPHVKSRAQTERQRVGCP